MNLALKKSNTYYARYSIYDEIAKIKDISELEFSKFIFFITKKDTNSVLKRTTELSRKSLDLISAKLNHEKKYMKLDQDLKKVISNIIDVVSKDDSYKHSNYKHTNTFISYFLKCGFRPDSDEIKKINIIGYFDWVNLLESLKYISQDIFETIFLNKHITENMLADNNEQITINIKNLMNTNKLKFNCICFDNIILTSFLISHGYSKIKTSSITTTDHNLKKLLNVISALSYSYTQRDICFFLHQTCYYFVSYSELNEYITKHIFPNFEEYKVRFNFQIFCDVLEKNFSTKATLNKIPIDHTINLINVLINILKSDILIEPISEEIMLKFCEAVSYACSSSSVQYSLTFNPTRYINSCISTFISKLMYVPSQKLFEYSIENNIQALFDDIVKLNNPSIKCTYSCLRFACLNMNVIMIKYMLEHKIIPKDDILRDMLIENKVVTHEILLLFKLYGYQFSDSICEILCFKNFTLDEYVDPNTSTISKKMAIYKKNGDGALVNLFKKNSVYDIKKYIEKNSVEPTIDCFRAGLQNDDYRVRELIFNKYKYIPSISTIINIERQHLRYALLVKFYPHLAKLDFSEEKNNNETSDNIKELEYKIDSETEKEEKEDDKEEKKPKKKLTDKKVKLIKNIQ